MGGAIFAGSRIFCLFPNSVFPVFPCQFFSDRRESLIFLLISGIKIGDIAVKFRGACIDHLVDRNDSALLPESKNFCLCHSPEMRDRGIGESHPLGLQQDIRVSGLCAELPFHLNNISENTQEKRIHTCCQADRLCHCFSMLFC